MPIFLSLDEIFILVFDFVNFCVVNMKYEIYNEMCFDSIFLYRNDLIMKG